MAWTVDNVFSFVKFLVRKNQTGSITADEFFLAWNSEQRSYMGDILGRIQDRSGKAGLIETDRALTILAPFTETDDITVASTGEAPKPDDFVYRLAVRAANKNVKMIRKGQIGAAINSSIDAPSVANGIYYGTEYDTFFKIWPATAGTITLDYIRNPAYVAWGSTNDGNGVAQYNAGTSTQPEWRDEQIQEITKRSLRLFGVSFSSQDFQQFAQSTIKSGN
jgi:hypothetical protein